MAGKEGLMLVLGGKPKGKPPGMGDDDEGDEAPDSEPGSSGSTMAGEAFDALKQGDREGFIAAFKAAVDECAMHASKGDDSEEY